MLSRDGLRRLCVDLQSNGIRFADGMPGRAGGAGPADSRTVIVADHVLSVPANSWFVDRSPYRAEPDGAGGYALYGPERDQYSLQVVQPCDLYRHHTAAGTPYEKIALFHGKDCLASTVYQDCQYRNDGEQCLFCGIGLSLAAGATVLHKQPAELAEVARHAALTGQACHVTLTCGSRADEGAATVHLAECVYMIKKESGLPVHIQICPPEFDGVLETLHDAGADTIGVHIETMCMQTLQRVAPAKARFGFERYRRTWQRAVKLFGTNQVSSFLIAGLGDTVETIVEGVRVLCGMGVFPYILPLRPVPGTPLEHACPPSSGFMVDVYGATAAVLKENGLASRASRAGCVRCGACSCLALFEDEFV